MPIGSKGAPVFIAGRGLRPNPMSNLAMPVRQPARYRISGITKNSAGVALGNCVVQVYESSSQATLIEGQEAHGKLRGSTDSGANGNYSLDVTGLGSGLTFTVVAYKAGTPDVAGTTVNTLEGF
jgi:hypothetical protein